MFLLRNTIKHHIQNGYVIILQLSEYKYDQCGIDKYHHRNIGNSFIVMTYVVYSRGIEYLSPRKVMFSKH